ncbi:DUF4148 domain-containing protein [Variovorax sp. KK3]|uniref:DUF4148 domain-containing protein n=1 Tax=Variovorax sp. KK3 TaxID=1855728 RepID=UPI00097BE0CB|nr:DUF4148 domain-containing protein [Variovorax sp. KK3]
MQIITRRVVSHIAFATAALCAAAGAQAFQGEQNPLPPQTFQSTLSRAAVQQEARRPVQISNGGTGVAMLAGMADRATVRAQALAISAKGPATYGEVQR